MEKEDPTAILFFSGLMGEVCNVFALLEKAVYSIGGLSWDSVRHSYVDDADNITITGLKIDPAIPLAR